MKMSLAVTHRPKTPKNISPLTLTTCRIMYRLGRLDERTVEAEIRDVLAKGNSQIQRFPSRLLVQSCYGFFRL